MTRDIQMLRGDWILETLTAIHRNQAKWIPMPPNHTPTSANLGRFHTPTQQYWPDTREDAAAPRPMYMTIRIPPDQRINYPGEELTITPTWARNLTQTLKDHQVHHAFMEYARGDVSFSIAYIDEHTHQAKWGLAPHALRLAAQLASESLPYNPNE